MSSDNASKKIVIGLAWIVGAAVLAWFSSVATMRLARTGEGAVTVTIESRLFGLIDVGQERIDGVRTVEMVSSRVPGTNSSTPDHMVFQTAAGPVNRGQTQQLFARDFSEIKTLLDDPTTREATLSSIARGAEFRRFLFAQATVAFLGLVGFAVAWSGFKSR
jgi:hypothetical protein